MTLQHGRDCPKKPHRGVGHLHADDDDRPYDVDGVVYCGRCHAFIGPDLAAAPVPCAASPADQFVVPKDIVEEQLRAMSAYIERLKRELDAAETAMLEAMHGYIASLPLRIEPLGGQRTSYVQRATVLDWLEVELEKRFMRATGEGARDAATEIEREVPDVSDAVDHRHRAIRGNDPVLPEVPEGRETATDRLAAPVAVSLDPHRLLREAFTAGYHCSWEGGRYYFDPAFKPGDPDGAFQAWLETAARLRGEATVRVEE